VGKIKVLDENLVNKIAAGEVIESPVSVVKELVENSIDAGSTRISIELKQAGRKLILVSDNGMGMNKGDALLAFERHATSKIKDDEDLETIMTLGFRGEALPSIAAVSKVEMVTRERGALSGTFVAVHGGVLKKVADIGCSEGTSIEVKSIFYNTPVRKKYLGSVNRDLQEIVKLIGSYMLAYPRISFNLVHNNVQLLTSSGRGDINEILLNVYGLDICKHFIPVNYSTFKEAADSSSFALKLSGFISKPELTRSSSRYITTFVNGRPIVNNTLRKAVLEGYHTFLEIRKYPVVILFVTIDPTFVDVNIHPGKRDVRFVDEKAVLELVQQGIAVTLKKADLVPRETLSLPLTSSSGLSLESRTEKDSELQLKLEHPEKSESKVLQTRKDKEHEILQKISDTRENIEKKIEQASLDFDIKAKKQFEFSKLVENFNVIGAVDKTYIICELDGDLAIIDQHAAHERVIYERLMKKAETQEELKSQGLLFPVILEMSSMDVLTLIQYLPTLKKLGFTIEHFGERNFIVKTVPLLLGKVDNKNTVYEILDQVMEAMPQKNINTLKEQLIITTACRNAIKAGDDIPIEAQQALLTELLNCKNPFTCPHGRPCMIIITKKELLKKFKRT